MFEQTPRDVLLAAGDLDDGGKRRPVLPPEFDWRDYTVMLLHITAEIEHSLMVQYLFSAYSLGGPQVPEGLRRDVRRWQEVILGIAKEEMGHLVTVQNALTALGGPVCLDREDYPWGSDFYPFQFTLRPLSAQSLATYVCAESPDGWSGEEADRIKELAAQSAGQQVNRVGALFARIDAIVADRERIPDSAFQANTLPYQATWDEWGRGYTRGARGRKAGSVPTEQSPDLLIFGVFSRDSVRKALHEVGEQGEALDTPAGGESSHFQRFLDVFREVARLPEEQQRLIARPVADNPVTAHRLNEWADQADAPQTNVITHPEAALWAHLFNVRYRMLLTNVSHAFRLAGPADPAGAPTDRGLLIHRAFAEMYNLRALAGKLVALPLAEGSDRRAGPPFEMPYSLDLPDRDHNRWLLQRDLLGAARLLVDELLTRHPHRVTDPYLTALAEADEQALSQVDRILSRAECRR
ncbi:ferritin-like domain-containing protein [Actinokineospora sp. NPDC004072]